MSECEDMKETEPQHLQTEPDLGEVPHTRLRSTVLVGADVCHECNGTGKIGDNGPGGIMLNGRWTGNSQWDICGCVNPISDNPGYRPCNCEDYPCCGH